MKHTPTPWTLEPTDLRGGRYWWVPEIDTGLHEEDNGEANARFIVRAVNSHDDLVKALEQCAAVCAGEVTTKRGLVEALEAARAALKKAKE